MDKAWVGVDAGKEFHWAHVLDASGRELLSRRVENDEAELRKLIDDALSLAKELIWALDQPGGGAALLLALLWERNQRVFYVPGLSVDRARDAYRGESKTDARDAHVIADQAPMRPDLGELEPGEQELAELQLLLARRRDLVTNQGRTITCLRLYPRTAKLSNTWAQANWINPSQFSAFLDQRVLRLRRLVSQEIVRSTTHLLAG
jgi:transposase